MLVITSFPSEGVTIYGKESTSVHLWFEGIISLDNFF